MKLVKFEKKLGLTSAVAITVGAVIGVAIFVIVGPMATKTGAMLPFAFAFAALPAIFGSLVASALGGTMPTDAGGFFYTKMLLGKKTATIASLFVIIGAIGAMVSVSTGVADYLNRYFPFLPRPLIASGLILLTWLVNRLGIIASARFQVLAVVQFVSAILLVIIAGIIGGATPDFSEPLPKGLPGFLEASVIAMLTYTGFNIIGELGDEVENPKKNLPLTIIFGLGIIIIIYFGVGWVVAGSLSLEELNHSKVAMLDTALKYLPPWTVHYINLAALSAAITSVNAVFLAVPREFLALSEEKMMPAQIVKFNSKRQNFPLAIAIISIIGCLLTLFNLDAELWGFFCVAGLMGANALVSIGILRLFALHPEKVKTSPLPIHKSWLYPAGVLSALFSIAFTGMAMFFYKPVLIVIIALSIIALILSSRTKPAP